MFQVAVQGRRKHLERSGSLEKGGLTWANIPSCPSLSHLQSAGTPRSCNLWLVLLLKAQHYWGPLLCPQKCFRIPCQGARLMFLSTSFTAKKKTAKGQGCGSPSCNQQGSKTTPRCSGPVEPARTGSPAGALAAPPARGLVSGPGSKVERFGFKLHFCHFSVEEPWA